VAGGRNRRQARLGSPQPGNSPEDATSANPTARYRPGGPAASVLPDPLRGDQGRLETAAGGADRRSAKNSDAPMHQAREAHRSAWPLHSPEGAMSRTAASGTSTPGSRGLHAAKRCTGRRSRR
jgi:hypothetical protein